MSKIFISYAKIDIQEVETIYDFLISENHEVWMDVHKLYPGQNWKLEIHNAIENADYFIACLSNNSVNKKGYVQKELKTAIEVLDLMPEGMIYIIPVRLEECQVPSFLKLYQWLDWYEKDSRNKLLHTINSHKIKEKDQDANRENIHLNIKLSSALKHIKAFTRELYPDLKQCARKNTDHAEPEIKNSTIKRVQAQLDILKAANVFDYHLAAYDLEKNTINRMYIHHINVLKLKSLIDEIEKYGI